MKKSAAPRGKLERPLIAGELICVEETEAGEGGRDRVRTGAGVEEDARLDVEVVTPAGLGERGAAECGEAVDAPAELGVASSASRNPLRA